MFKSLILVSLIASVSGSPAAASGPGAVKFTSVRDRAHLDEVFAKKLNPFILARAQKTIPGKKSESPLAEFINVSVLREQIYDYLLPNALVGRDVGPSENGLIQNYETLESLSVLEELYEKLPKTGVEKKLVVDELKWTLAALKFRPTTRRIRLLTDRVRQAIQDISEGPGEGKTLVEGGPDGLTVDSLELEEKTDLQTDSDSKEGSVPEPATESKAGHFSRADWTTTFGFLKKEIAQGSGVFLSSHLIRLRKLVAETSQIPDSHLNDKLELQSWIGNLLLKLQGQNKTPVWVPLRKRGHVGGVKSRQNSQDYVRQAWISLARVSADHPDLVMHFLEMASSTQDLDFATQILVALIPAASNHSALLHACALVPEKSALAGSDPQELRRRVLLEIAYLVPENQAILAPLQELAKKIVDPGKRVRIALLLASWQERAIED